MGDKFINNLEILTKMDRRSFLMWAALAAAGCRRGVDFDIVPPRKPPRGKALIVNGDHIEKRHFDNVLRSHRFFEGIGFDRRDITTLSAPYGAFALDEDKLRRSYQKSLGFSLPVIDGPATKGNARASLDSMLRSVTPRQEIFVYLTGHGFVDDARSMISLQIPHGKEQNPKPDLADIELRRMLDQGNYGGAVVLFDGCEGEGFSNVVGDTNTLAIAKNRKGKTSTCTYFADTFFHTPWTVDSDLDNSGAISMLEALQYTDRILADGGAPAEIIISGGYNPSLVEGDIERGYRMFSVFYPNSEIQVLNEPSEVKLQRAGATLVDDVSKVEKMISDERAVAYFSLDGCRPCANLTDHLLRVFSDDPGKARHLYVLPSFYGTEPEDRMVESNYPVFLARRKLGVKVETYPTLISLEKGKEVGRTRLPKEVVTYGNLPDRMVEVGSTDAVRKILI